jgi:hypothetical protein
MELTGHVEQVGEITDSYNILVEKLTDSNLREDMCIEDWIILKNKELNSVV